MIAMGAGYVPSDLPTSAGFDLVLLDLNMAAMDGSCIVG